MAEKTKTIPEQAAGGIPKPAQKDSLALAALSYIFPLAALLVFILSKEDKYARFHALQALILDIAFYVAWMALIIITMISIVTIVCYFILVPLLFVFFFGFLAYKFYCAWRAFKGTEFEIPRVTKIALEHMQ
ncbi:hypothetical protein HY992_01680 [Candidatus Micrarchaeota archaeon]|nr:hypothetical protein [Candidatus Micrarchaeota archaeon]